jgi:hypothetical protein
MNFLSGCMSNTHTYSQTGVITAQAKSGSIDFSKLTNFLKRNRRAIRDGIPLAQALGMGWICQHCGAPFTDSAYRVKSEESGVILLDIIVCQHCYVEARDLGLHTERLRVRNSSGSRNHSSSRKKPAFRRRTENDRESKG